MKKIVLLSLLAGVILTGCKDVFITDLDDIQVSTLSPVDNANINDATIIFWWDELKEEEYDVSSYRIQVVTPSFANVSRIELDTIVTGERFQIGAFLPGDYEWKIRARNSVSETEDPKAQSFTVATAIDISGTKPILTSPISNAELNLPNFRFRWTGSTSTDNYVLNCRRVSDGQLIIDNRVVDVSGSLIPQDGQYDTTITDMSIKNYEWTVQGKNSLSVSDVSEVGKFQVDTTGNSAL